LLTNSFYFRETILALDHANLPLDKSAKIVKDSQIMIKLLQREEELLTTQKNKKSDISKSPSVLLHKEENFFVSPALNFGSSVDEGRFAQAKSKINVSEPILVEKPHCSVLLENFSKTHCDNCFKM
jgi:SET and MYND domain-containing protein 4